MRYLSMDILHNKEAGSDSDKTPRWRYVRLVILSFIVGGLIVFSAYTEQELAIDETGNWVESSYNRERPPRIGAPEDFQPLEQPGIKDDVVDFYRGDDIEIALTQKSIYWRKEGKNEFVEAFAERNHLVANMWASDYDHKSRRLVVLEARYLEPVHSNKYSSAYHGHWYNPPTENWVMEYRFEITLTSHTILRDTLCPRIESHAYEHHQKKLYRYHDIIIDDHQILLVGFSEDSSIVRDRFAFDGIKDRVILDSRSKFSSKSATSLFDLLYNSKLRFSSNGSEIYFIERLNNFSTIWKYTVKRDGAIKRERLLHGENVGKIQDIFSTPDKLLVIAYRNTHWRLFSLIDQELKPIKRFGRYFHAWHPNQFLLFFSDELIISGPKPDQSSNVQEGSALQAQQYGFSQAMYSYRITE
jgi:hypothetical protein